MSCRQCVGSTTVGTVGPRFWSSLAALVSVSRTIDIFRYNSQNGCCCRGQSMMFFLGGSLYVCMYSTSIVAGIHVRRCLLCVLWWLRTNSSRLIGVCFSAWERATAFYCRFFVSFVACSLSIGCWALVLRLLSRFAFLPCKEARAPVFLQHLHTHVDHQQCSSLVG